ncbi:uncharacterized protein LOC128036138 [Gossypium raimondii]|uniref:uncharacterized protein LOC128036138 n=1 Tax=Gossypium raimondii TaxID=29730 RepID=UPI00227C558A|nr:uncharacterized protein LOC128036138 [Gossypium raimondii]
MAFLMKKYSLSNFEGFEVLGEEHKVYKLKKALYGLKQLQEHEDEPIEDFKKRMQHVFEMTDLGLMTYFLGMEIGQGSDGIFISQQTFASKSTFKVYAPLHNVAHLKATKRVLSWSSKKQQTVAQSTAEAEYISAAAAVNQAIWLRKILGDLNESQIQPTEIRVDNQSAVAIAKNPVFHVQGGVLKPWLHCNKEPTNKLVKDQQ